jgi:hypothetical protein
MKQNGAVVSGQSAVGLDWGCVTSAVFLFLEAGALQQQQSLRLPTAYWRLPFDGH